MLSQGRNSGMTLVETLVATFLLALFGLAAASSLTLAMRQWQMVGQKVNAIQNARFLTGVIANELRTAIACPNTTLGYPSVGTAAVATLMPNATTNSSNNLTFTEPNQDSSHGTLFNPTNTSPPFNLNDASIYKLVTYTVVNNSTVTRQSSNCASGATSWTANPAETIALGQNVTLTFVSLANQNAPNQVSIAVACQEGRYLATYATNCTIIAGTN